MFTLRPAPRTELRGGSRCDSQIGWGPHIRQVFPGTLFGTQMMTFHVIQCNFRTLRVPKCTMTSGQGSQIPKVT